MKQKVNGTRLEESLRLLVKQIIQNYVASKNKG